MDVHFFVVTKQHGMPTSMGPVLSKRAYNVKVGGNGSL